MARVTQQRTRQALLVTGDPLDPFLLPEKLQLFNQLGDPLSIPIGHRRQVDVITASLGAATDTGKLDTRLSGEGESGSVELGAGVLLTKISVNRPSRIRFYTTAAKRDADVDRLRFTDPMDYPEADATLDHGCLSEFLLLTVLAMDNIPADYLTSGDGGTNIYYRIDNYDLSTGTITVNLTIKDVEQ